MERRAAHNSSYKKLAVQWLNEALCFVSNLVLADSFVLRNRQLLVAANRYRQFLRTLYKLQSKINRQTFGTLTIAVMTQCSPNIISNKTNYWCCAFNP